MIENNQKYKLRNMFIYIYKDTYISSFSYLRLRFLLITSSSKTVSLVISGTPSSGRLPENKMLKLDIKLLGAFYIV